MAEKADSGHGKNGANFTRLKDEISIMAGYQPSAPLLIVSAIVTKNDTAQNVLKDLMDARSTFEMATNNRRILFKTVNPLFTRLIDMLRASGASRQQVADGMYYQRKMQGRRAKPKMQPVEGAEPADEPKYISVSQVSYDNKIEHLSKFTSLLAGEPLYHPNEPELQVANIKLFLAQLKSANKAVSLAASDLRKAIHQRQIIFYEPTTGVFDIAMAVKRYVKSALTPDSVSYQLIHKLKFTDLRGKKKK